MIKLLLVEDSEDVIGAFVTFFEAKAPDRYDIAVARNLAETKDLLTAEKFDIVVTDFNFPGGNGDDVANLAHQKGIPKIFLHSADPSQGKSKHYTEVLPKLNLPAFKKTFF